jgi:hypothetical protein
MSFRPPPTAFVRLRRSPRTGTTLYSGTAQSIGRRRSPRRFGGESPGDGRLVGASGQRCGGHTRLRHLPPTAAAAANRRGGHSRPVAARTPVELRRKVRHRHVGKVVVARRRSMTRPKRRLLRTFSPQAGETKLRAKVAKKSAAFRLLPLFAAIIVVVFCGERGGQAALGEVQAGHVRRVAENLPRLRRGEKGASPPVTVTPAEPRPLCGRAARPPLAGAAVDSVIRRQMVLMTVQQKGASCGHAAAGGGVTAVGHSVSARKEPEKSKYVSQGTE